MTTKEDVLFLKKQTSKIDKSNKFLDLNLNQNHKCSDYISHKHSFSKSNSNKNSVICITLGCSVTDIHEKDKEWNKSTKVKSFKTSESSRFSSNDEKEGPKHSLIDNNISNEKNSSTLSLHIAAYENCVETAESNDFEDLSKKSTTFKSNISLLKVQINQDSLEFPRQMEDKESSTTPQIQQFKASQRLFTPNQDGAATSTSSDDHLRQMSNQVKQKGAMSVYFGTAIPPTGIKNILYGNFISAERKSLILVRPNRLDLCEFNHSGIKIVHEVAAKGKIIGSVKVKINPNDTKECVAFLTTKLQLVFYSFDDNGNAEVRVMGTIDKGIGNDSTTGILMVALKKNAIIVHCKSSSIEYVTWERSADAKKMTFITKQYRRYAFIAGIVPLDNEENHFAIVEKDGHSYQCSVAREDILNEDILPVESYPIQDVGIDYRLVIPFDKIPGGVLVVSCTKVTFMSPNHVQYFPLTCLQRQYLCWTSLSAQTRFLLADDNGDICVLSVELNGPDKIADIKIEKIGVGPIPTCIQRFDKGQFLVSSWLGDHQLLRIGRSEDGCFFVENVETLNNLAPAVDIVSIEKRSDRKLVVSSGAYKHGSLRIIKNCMSIYTMAKYPFAYVPTVYPLNFLSSSKSRFAIRRQHGGYEILEVNESNLSVQRFSKPETFASDFPRFETLNDTLFVGVIEPHFYIHITSKGGTITTLTGETVATLPACSAADVKRCGDIVISKENFVQWYHFDAGSGSLTKLAEQKFRRPVWNIKFANSEDSNCRLCFVVPFISKNFYLVEYPVSPGSLTSAIKIPVAHGKVVVTPTLITFPNWRSYIVCAMDDGSVDYYQYDPVEKSFGHRETLNVGVQPPLLCKIYVQRQLHLILCSDQTTVMKSDKHSLGFCNMDVKDVGFMLPLSAKVDQESVNSLLYYSEGHICLGKIIDKQKMTIQKIAVGETLTHLEHDVDTNVLVASSCHSNLITVSPNGQEKIDEPQTLVTSFENLKRMQWAASDEYKYEMGAGPAAIQYIEDITSLVIFGADRFTILDAIQLSRFEEILCMTIAKFSGDTYVFCGTALAFPGQDNVEQGRILVFRIEPGISRSEPSGMLRQVLDKTVKSAVYGIKANGSSIKAFVGTVCVDVIFNPSQHTLELLHIAHIGHFVYCNSTAFNDELTALTASDALQTLVYAKLDTGKEKEDGKIVARERGLRAFLSLNFLSDHKFIGADSEENITVFSDIPPKDHDGFATNSNTPELTNLGSMYLGQAINQIRAGAPFLPIYAKPKKSNFNHRYFSSADGTVGIFANVEEDVFTFLKAVEMALSKKNPSVCDQITFRSTSNIPYNESPFIDGDFLRELLAYPNPDEMTEGIAIPKSLESENPGLSPGYIAFNYLRQLWSLH